MDNQSHWLTTDKLITELECSKPQPEVIPLLIIGSGFVGSTLAYLYSKNNYFPYIKVIDYKPKEMASVRNCGHILTGPAESAHALSMIYGEENAKTIWDFTVDSCKLLKKFIVENKLTETVNYKQEGQFCVAIDETEAKENLESKYLLNKWGYKISVLDSEQMLNHGIKCINAKFDALCATANPLKYRNELLKHAHKSGKVALESDIQVLDIEETEEYSIVKTNKGDIRAEVVIVAANAYSPLLSKDYSNRSLVEPFKGQIMVSKPLKNPELITGCPLNFDHGFQYSLKTPDNRLILGGWRKGVEGMETGSYDMTNNEKINEGLKGFAKEYLQIGETIEWESSWTGLMASSRSGLPIVGPVSESGRIWTVSSCNGHGFSQSFGACKLLVDQMLGNDYNKNSAKLFTTGSKF